MGVLIRMSSGDFLNKFIKEFDYNDYRFLLISEDIKTEKHKNVFTLKCLIPPAHTISEFVANGFSDKYVKKYAEYLNHPKIALLIGTIVRMVVAENRKVVLMCSDKENEFKFLKVLADYINATYDVKVYSYKKYAKDPEAAENVKYKKKFIINLDERIEELSEKAKNVPDIVDPKKYAKAQFKALTKEDLIRYCKDNGLKVKKGDGKKDIIKRI